MSESEPDVRKAESGKQKSDNEIISVLGGIDVEVKYRPVVAIDPNRPQESSPPESKKETVKVRELGADEMLRYHSVIDFEGSTVELFCNKPKGWADTLTRESLELILKIGEEDCGNLKHWSGWRARQAARMEKMMPGTMDLMEKAIATILNKRSPDSSLPSQSETASQ